MSIYINGVEMPKHDDEYVIFTVYGDGGVVYGPLNRHHVRYKDRAVPVPPHGRLGDLDALEIYHREEVALKAYKENPDSEYFEGIKDAWHEAAKLLSAAPTIIPAEEGE